MPRITLPSVKTTARVPTGLHISRSIASRPAGHQYSFIPCLRLPDFGSFSEGSASHKLVKIMAPLGNTSFGCLPFLILKGVCACLSANFLTVSVLKPELRIRIQNELPNLELSDLDLCLQSSSQRGFNWFVLKRGFSPIKHEKFVNNEGVYQRMPTPTPLPLREVRQVEVI